MPQDFFDVSRMSKPQGFLEIQQRLSYNLSYFSANYLIIIVLFFLYCILTNIGFFLFVGVETGLGFYLLTNFGNADELDLKIFKLHRNIVYGALLIINIPLLFFWSPFGAIIWNLIMSAGVISLHASLMDRPVEATYSDMA